LLTGKPARTRGLFIVVLLLLGSVLSAQQPGRRDVSGETARSSVSWVTDSVIYEIYPRSFSARGNFDGVTERLDELKELGVTLLWLMPIHPISREKKKGSIGSPYAVRDYYGINPDYGTRNDLRRLVDETHKRGMRIIIDIVINHTGWDSVLMKEPEFYQRDASGRIVSPHDWTDVAALDYRNQKLRAYMIEMLKYWLRELDLDGFRCDVAGEVPTDFWESARAELEKVKPNIVMLAEADKPELLVHAFDLDYAWPFHAAINDVFAGGSPATTLRKTWERERADYPRRAIHMRFWDNHDEERAIARFGKRGALAASALVLTMDGVPLLYNGAEAGDATESGAPALFERLPVFWKIAERRPEFRRFYQAMIALRREHAALRQGETTWLANSEETRILTYIRRTAEEEFLVAINASNRPFAGSVDLQNASSFDEVTSNAAWTEGSARQQARLPALSLDSWGFRIYRLTVHR